MQQYEGRPAVRLGTDALIDALRVPARELQLLAVGQVRLHREVGLRQVHGLLVVSHGQSTRLRQDKRGINASSALGF